MLTFASKAKKQQSCHTKIPKKIVLNNGTEREENSKFQVTAKKQEDRDIKYWLCLCSIPDGLDHVDVDDQVNRMDSPTVS